jgi:ribosome-associated translation inhibitor RaiA
MPKPNTAPVVKRDGLHLQDYDNPIPLGSPQWVEWLEHNKSFRFQGESIGYEIQPGTGFLDFEDITFTAFKSKNGKYWNAQRRVNGTLRGQYIGSHQDLTYQRMMDVGLILNSKNYYREGQKRGRSLGGSVEKSYAESHTEYKTEIETSPRAADEIAQLKTELEEYKAKCNALEIKLQGTEKALEHEREDAKRYYPLWRKYPDLERQNRRLKQKLEDYSLTPLKTLDTWIEANQIRMDTRTADKLRSYREYLARSSMSADS